MTDIIRDLPIDERPREKMLRIGPDMMSTTDLLALVLGTGAPGKNALELARELLVGGIKSLQRREIPVLIATRGVGPAKAARIAAVFELSRRLSNEKPQDGDLFDIPTLGEQLVRGYGEQQQERLGAAFLDSRRRVRTRREIFIGTMDKTLVSTRDIVRYALQERATGVVVYHNHPSGDPTPSADDVTFTKKLQHSLAMVDLELVDHLVIGAHRYCSMKERGHLL